MFAALPARLEQGKPQRGKRRSAISRVPFSRLRTHEEDQHRDVERCGDCRQQAGWRRRSAAPRAARRAPWQARRSARQSGVSAFDLHQSRQLRCMLVIQNDSINHRFCITLWGETPAATGSIGRPRSCDPEAIGGTRLLHASLENKNGEPKFAVFCCSRPHARPKA